MKRRSFIQTPVLMAGATLCGAVLAQDAYPSKPIRLIIPSAPGGSTDVVARTFGERMAKTLKQPVLIENMTGAGTLLATRHVLRSPADGYTMIVSANTVVTLPYVDKSAGFMPSDFTAVANLSKTPLALVVSAESPFTTLAELIAAAKKQPGILTFASLGIGTTSHIPVELFAQEAGIKLQLITYRASPLAIPDVVAGRVTMIMGNYPAVGELIKAGKLRALAVTSPTRSSSFPNVPSFSELGFPDATYELFMGIVAPAKTPAAVLKLVSDAVEDAKKDPELRKKLGGQAMDVAAEGSPEQFNAYLRREEEKMKKVVKAANIQAETK